MIIPVTEDGQIIIALQEQPNKLPFMGTIGGRVNDEEDILEAAKREFLEETGYESNDWMLFSSVQPVSKIEWAIYTFIAKGLNKVAEMKLDAGEKIILKPVSFDEFMEIAISKNFEEKEIVSKIYEAKLYPEKKEELRKLFKP